MINLCSVPLHTSPGASLTIGVEVGARAARACKQLLAVVCSIETLCCHAARRGEPLVRLNARRGT